jgi:hypothetical protein
MAQYDEQVYAPAPPPELPVYEQPAIPGYGYIWTPGYWSYGPFGYFWVPGTWVEPPSVGLLWTPGYWGFIGGRYLFNAGYWGPTVGFYGGINYGFGYGGFGYEGGYWRDGRFAYNSRVNNFGGVHITNVYERNVTNVTVNRVAFNGPGGIDRRPMPAEVAAMHANHIPATTMQVQHVRMAQSNEGLRASVNHGTPAIMATSRPGAFTSGPAAAHPGMPATRPGGFAPHPVPRPEPAAPRPAARPEGYAPHPAAGPGAYAPHPVARPEGGMSAPPRAAEPREPMQPHYAAPEQRAPMAQMAPRPMAAPRPAMAPRPAPAPRPEGGHEEKPR